jgi:hypothetical protein
MPSLGIAARFVAVMAGAVLFSGLAAVALWTHDHSVRRQAALNAEAVQVLEELTNALQARLNLGLPLGRVPNVAQLLEVARLQLQEAGSVAVLDEDGRGVFSTAPGEVGDTLLSGSIVGNSPAGYRRIGDELLFWSPVTVENGTRVGTVLLRLEAGPVGQGVGTFALSLLARTVPAIGMLAAIAAALGMWLAEFAGRRATATAATLNALDGATHDRAANRAGLLPCQPLDELAASVARLHRLLESGEDELERLDELA